MQGAGEMRVSSAAQASQRSGKARLGIRSKLFVASIALIGVSLLVAEIYLTRALEAQLLESVRDELLVRARLVAERASDIASVSHDVPALDRLADHLSVTAGGRVTLVRRDGTVAGDSEVAAEDLARLDNHGARTEIAQALAAREGVGTRLSSTVQERLMYVAVPITHEDDVIGAARIAVPLDRIDVLIGELRATLAAAALVALAVAAVLSWLAAHLVSRNLRQLTAAARGMAAGNLALRTRIPGHDEVAALGRALDQLAGNLSRTLEELRAERDLLDGILGSMAEGVLVVGPDGHIVLMNAALKAMLLVSGEPAGKNVLHVVRNADLSETLDRAREGTPAEMELELGGLMPRRLLMRARALEDAPGSVLAVLVDLSELRRLESVRRDFVANASHELRSPLTSIRAAAETLESAHDDPDSAKRFIDLIVRNAERLQNLVDDMLELSRIESREVQLELEVLPLDAVAERVVAHHLPRAGMKRIALACASGMPTVRADRRALEHVLGNLIDNALKYCAEGATVRVGAARENGRVRISVSDDGPGIAPQHLERIFERFYRVDPGRSRELGGTGLGLAIVKHLVEAMGGTAAVESRVGAGSTFSFTLLAGA
jgi:two-component system, OmpR family, phosphate regulon sensor histidine kinase PhoR